MLVKERTCWKYIKLHHPKKRSFILFLLYLLNPRVELFPVINIETHIVKGITRRIRVCRGAAIVKYGRHPKSYNRMEIFVHGGTIVEITRFLWEIEKTVFIKSPGYGSILRLDIDPDNPIQYLLEKLGYKRVHGFNTDFVTYIKTKASNLI